MTYLVIYRAHAWVRAEAGIPEWRQVVTTNLDDGTHLVVVVARAASGGAPRVAQARIEQPYITRTAGWKRRTIRRLRPDEIELVVEAEVS
jgi:hypothetical protein